MTKIMFAELEREREAAARLYVKNQLDEAEKIIRRIIRRCPTYAPAWTLLGDIVADRGFTKKAIRIYQKASQLDPSDPEPVWGCANVLLGEGNARAVIPYARKAMRLASKQRRFGKEFLELVYDVFAEALILDKRRQEAMRVLDEGIRRTGGKIVLRHLRRSIRCESVNDRHLSQKQTTGF
jgi:predicted Zn-dependent protease